jgi:hypothetical protein
LARPIEATSRLEGSDTAKFISAAQSPKPYTPQGFDLKKMQEAIDKIVAKREIHASGLE